MKSVSVLLLPLVLEGCSGQLVGSRGVVGLPDGFQYRDQETLLASMAASRFAKHFQPINDIVAEQNKLVELQRSQFQQERTPIFYTFGQQSLSLVDNDTLYINDIKNIPLTFREVFRETSDREDQPTTTTVQPPRLANSVTNTKSVTIRRLPVGVSLPKYLATFHFRNATFFI